MSCLTPGMVISWRQASEARASRLMSASNGGDGAKNRVPGRDEAAHGAGQACDAVAQPHGASTKAGLSPRGSRMPNTTARPSDSA